MSEVLRGPDWLEAEVDSYLEVGATLMRVRRVGDRRQACREVLIGASDALVSRVCSSICVPSVEHVVPLGQIAGMAAAARVVSQRGSFNTDLSATPEYRGRTVERLPRWACDYVSGLMAASDGEMQTLLWGGQASELRANKLDDKYSLIQPAFNIGYTAELLAEINLCTQPRGLERHHQLADWLTGHIGSTTPPKYANVSAHAFAVHYLTGEPGGKQLRQRMLNFIAAHPPHDGAPLQASRVAGLLSDWQGRRVRMGLLDRIIRDLGPNTDSDAAVHEARARDRALVLVLLDDDEVERPRAGTISGGAQSSTQEGSRVTVAGRDPRLIQLVSDIGRLADQAIDAVSTDRAQRYDQAIAAGSVSDALAVVRDAAVGDHEQAWNLLRDLAGRGLTDDAAGQLTTVASNVLGDVALDSDEEFTGPGAGTFTVLSPDPAIAAAAINNVLHRLLNVDDQGVEHADSLTAHAAGRYTPNYLHDLLWCDRGAQISLDTKGSMPAPMARAMLIIITDALVRDRVPAVLTGFIPDLAQRMVPWAGHD